MMLTRSSLDRWRDPARQAAQTTAAGLLTFAFMKVTGLPHLSWALISALYLIQPSIGGTLSSLLFRIVGALLGSAVGLACLYLIGTQGWWAALSLAIAALFIDMVAAWRPDLRYGHVTAGILIVSDAVGEEAMASALERTLAIGIGALFAGVAAVLIFPRSAHRRAERHLAQALRRCGDLLSAAAAGLLGEERPRLMPLHDDIRRHLEGAASAAARSHRTRFWRREGPRYGHLVHSVQRLWDTLIIIDRADRAALPETARRALGPALERLADTACAYFAHLGQAIEARRPPPRPDAVAARLAELNDRLDAFQHQSENWPLPNAQVEQIYALAFALEELTGNFREIADLFGRADPSARPE